MPADNKRFGEIGVKVINPLARIYNPYLACWGAQHEAVGCSRQHSDCKSVRAGHFKKNTQMPSCHSCFINCYGENMRIFKSYLSFWDNDTEDDNGRK